MDRPSSSTPLGKRDDRRPLPDESDHGSESIVGSVLDHRYQAVPDVSVSVCQLGSVSQNLVQSSVSNAQGEFRFDGLRKGAYVIVGKTRNEKAGRVITPAPANGVQLLLAEELAQGHGVNHSNFLVVVRDE